MENNTPNNNNQPTEPQLPFTFRNEQDNACESVTENVSQPDNTTANQEQPQNVSYPTSNSYPQQQVAQPVQNSVPESYPTYSQQYAAQPVQNSVPEGYPAYPQQYAAQPVQNGAPEGYPAYPPQYAATPVQNTYGGYPQSPYQYPYNGQQTPPPNGFHQNGTYPPAPNPYNPSVAYPPVQNRPQQPKKVSIGLYIIITVLSVLLVASATGIIVYLASNSEKSKSTHSNYNDIFGDYSNDYTFPNYDEDKITPDTESNSHPESDYSDKVNKDYSGLKLNEKPSDADSNKSYNTGYAINQITDSVVGIVCYKGKEKGVNNSTTQGSGIIISSDGYVLTNSHVIGDSKTTYSLEVVTSDNKVYTAGVVGYDTRTDIALLKMDDAKDLKAAQFADSSKLSVGDDIVVVGNPGGLQYNNSSTKGIVSAIDRELSSATLVKYIQTDAPINPGNSGGPLVNTYGQVVGMATAKIVSEDYEGMGFAIPSVTVKQIADSLMKNGYVYGRVKLGITGTVVSSYTAMLKDIPEGIIVSEITKDGPCDKTDLKKDDIIIGVDKKEIKNFSDVYKILENHKEGDKIELMFYRPSDDKEYTIEITLQADKS